MVKLLRCPARWLIVCYLIILTSVLAACGGTSASSSSGNPPSAENQQKASPLIVSIREKKSTTNEDAYEFTPTSITVKKGDTITIRNLSDEVQDIDQGDAQKAGIDAIVPVHGSVIVTFNNPGTFMLQSNHDATITVSVN